jgi:chemotaxis protein MotC
VRSSGRARVPIAALAAAFVLVAAGTFAHAATGESPEPASPAADAGPVALVRSLQILQEQIANGSVAAHAAQSTLLARIEKRFTQEPPETWQDPHNARAAVFYLLGGG